MWNSGIQIHGYIRILYMYCSESFIKLHFFSLKISKIQGLQMIRFKKPLFSYKNLHFLFFMKMLRKPTQKIFSVTNIVQNSYEIFFWENTCIMKIYCLGTLKYLNNINIAFIIFVIITFIQLKKPVIDLRNIWEIQLFYLQEIYF